MDRNTMERLLAGISTRHETLAVGMERKGKKNFSYYFELNSMAQLLQIRSTLQEAAAATPELFVAFPGIRHPYYYAQPKKDVDRELVIRLQDDPVWLTLRFLPIMGIHYRTSFGGRIEPFVETGKSLYTLRVRKSTGELQVPGARRGFATEWWFNKLCRRNILFRNFFVAFFGELGKTRYIFKDLARTLKEDAFILPQLAYDEWIQFHTPKDLIRHFSRLDLGMDYNKMDINAAFYLACIAELVAEQDRGLLREIPQRRVVEGIEPRDLYQGVNIERFTGRYYEWKFRLWYSATDLGRLATDYAMMCREGGQNVRLGFNSPQRLAREHDHLARLRRSERAEDLEGPLVPEGSRFAALQRLKRHGFEYITETRRLFEEGEQMHNCVFSYRNMIRADRCAILHWAGQERGPYTIEVKDNGRCFLVTQMQTRYNRGYSVADLRYVQDLLQRVTGPQWEELEEEIQDIFGDLVEFQEV